MNTSTTASRWDPTTASPPRRVAHHWIEAANIRQPADTESLRRWWTFFNDPKLNYLVDCAYRQNLTVAGSRVPRAAVAGCNLPSPKATLFPQTQTASADIARIAEALTPAAVGATRFFDIGTRLQPQWELDFWGQFRRAVAAADDNLDASVEGYDAAIVTMLGDIARRLRACP